LQQANVFNLEIDKLWKLSNREIFKELINHDANAIQMNILEDLILKSCKTNCYTENDKSIEMIQRFCNADNSLNFNTFLMKILILQRFFKTIVKSKIILKKQQQDLVFANKINKIDTSTHKFNSIKDFGKVS
jgi:hypothetical protein